MSHASAIRMDEPGVAIVGMAGRFPGAPDLATYWTNLREGRICIRVFSEEELRSEGVAAELLKRPNYVRAAGVIDSVDLFDAAFFGFTPREAEVTDPQQRVFLECAWEALERAGYDPLRYRGSIGVYAGSSTNGYVWLGGARAGRYDQGGCGQMTFGNDRSFLTTRVSYKLNLRGPSIDVQTACSTSLVAVHLACQSLLSGECDLALAGGVSINPRREGHLYQEGGIKSPDGRCRAFDARAQGTVVGNGAGIVVLSRLEDALENGDHIHAVIRASAVNNDGGAKVGYTAPSVDGQAAVIREALAVAEVNPETIGYVEAHGTATLLGDPIEVAALAQAYGARSSRRSFCALGAVKASIGHLDEAAGVAGLIKTVLALEQQVLPPLAGFESPNPHIDFSSSPFYVSDVARPWPADGGPRRAGVSAFGIGGTNAHVILEEAPAARPADPGRPASVLVLSAKTATALERASANLAACLRTDADAALADVAYTLQVGRAAFPHRRMLVCREAREAADGLERHAAAAGEPARPRRLAFLFPGQGAQHVSMAVGLYEHEPGFRRELDRCAEILEPHLGLDLRSVLYPAGAADERRQLELDQTALAQPALFAVEYSLARLWNEWGVVPDAMVGHSVGEYVAACLAGVFSLEDALGLVAARGLLMQGLPPGAMLAVPLARDAVEAELADMLAVAAVNAASRCVVSGPVPAIEALERRFAERGLACARLRTSHAFHSPMVEPILGPFRERVERVARKPPQVANLSNVTGTWVTAAEATDSDYWVRHLREPVRLADALHELLADPDGVLLEVGPGQTLVSLARQQRAKGAGTLLLPSLRTGAGGQSDVTDVVDALGRLWVAGARVSWEGFHAHEQRRRVPLPTYPFERQRYWLGGHEDASSAEAEPTEAGGREPAELRFYVPSWRRTVWDAGAGPGELDGAGTWLLFLDPGGVGAQLADRLRQLGGRVVRVEAGAAFANVGEDAYVLDPARREDYEDLLVLMQGALATLRVVHLWGLTPATTGSADGHDAFVEQQRLGFYSLVFLGQALARQVPSAVSLHVVTSGTQVVTGDEILRPGKATVLSACKVLPQEHPNLTCRCIDLDLDEARRPPAPVLVDQLLAELAARSAETVVAHRSRHRWAQTFEGYPAQQAGGGMPLLRTGGVYLITGGLGGLGLVFAAGLAERCQAQLVLTSRTPLPPRDEWERWRESHDRADPTRRRIETLQRIEASGGKVLALPADVADEGEMRRVLRVIDDAFGRLDGVVHAAGASKDVSRTMLDDTRPSHGDEQFRAKVHGLYVLENVLAGRTPDFCLLCSSLASVLGGLGFGAYAAANQFMDAFAQDRSRRSALPWLSVNWDGWELCGEGGSGADARQITEQQGLAALVRLTALRGVAQVAVSPADVRARLEGWIDRAAAPKAACEAGHLKAASPRPAPRALPRNEIERRVAGVWRQLLGTDVGIHDNFAEVGGDSLTAVNLLAQLGEEFRVAVPLRQFLTTPTIAGLADFLEKATSAPAPAAGEGATVETAPPLPGVVALRAGGSRPPLFLLHRAGGSVLCYQELAGLLTDRPSYALQPSNGSGPSRSVEEMAGLYASWMRAVQPRGPYRVGGSSMGGTLAFEVAQQLFAAGEEVALLALFDTPGPEDLPPEWEDDLAALTCISGGDGATPEAQPPAGGDRGMLAILDRAGVGVGLPQEARLRAAKAFVELFKDHVGAMRAYRLRPYPGRVTFFRAQERGSYSAHPEAPWVDVAGRGIEVYTVPGTHESMVEKPAVRALAERLERCLDAAERR